MFQCPNCEREFEKKRGMETHNRLAHKDDDVVETIRKVKVLAKEVGGLSKLKELTEVLT